MRALAIALLILLLGCGCAEEALGMAELGPMEEFAREHAPGLDARDVARRALEGETGLSSALDWLKEQALAPLEELLARSAVLLAPTLLLAATGCTLRGQGPRFLLRVSLLLGLAAMTEPAIEAAGELLGRTAAFSDAVAPAFSALLTATGMGGSAAMISPGAALAGSLAGDVFLRFGLPLCRLTLGTALAGNLSRSIDLGALVKLLRRVAAWGAGLAFTLFSTLVLLQGNLSAALDGVGVRTAKYAVDSAAPIIGSGVSEAWEAYVSGVMAAKSALGVSGVALLLAAGIQPMLRIGGAMVVMQLSAVLMELLGEKDSARAAEQACGVCRMALELCTSALAISMILLGAIMSAGRAGLGG